MKKIVLYTFLSVALIFTITFYFSSCKQDPCKTRNVVCENGGSCNDGDCVCAIGYEGDSCQFKWNQKFDSYYACERAELINNIPPSYDNDDTLRIKANTDKFAITLYSIRDSVVQVLTATVNNNTFTIPSQNKEFPDHSVYNYTGAGSLTNGVLTATIYKVKKSPTTDWSSKTTIVGYKYE